jgi:hypothetical protein
VYMVYIIRTKQVHETRDSGSVSDGIV